MLNILKKIFGWGKKETIEITAETTEFEHPSMEISKSLYYRWPLLIKSELPLGEIHLCQKYKQIIIKTLRHRYILHDCQISSYQKRSTTGCGSVGCYRDIDWCSLIFESRNYVVKCHSFQVLSFNKNYPDLTPDMIITCRSGNEKCQE